MIQILGSREMRVYGLTRKNLPQSSPYGGFRQMPYPFFVPSILYITAGGFNMELVLSSTLGTIFYTVVVFVAGALIGGPLWKWVDSKLPWNK